MLKVRLGHTVTVQAVVKHKANIFLPLRCLGIADWQPNSVPGPLGTPPTVMITAHFTISHITVFFSI